LVPVKDVPAMSFSAAWKKDHESDVLRAFLEILKSAS